MTSILYSVEKNNFKLYKRKLFPWGLMVILTSIFNQKDTIKRDWEMEKEIAINQGTLNYFGLDK